MSPYQQVAPHLPPEAYHDVAREAFDRLTPEEREQFAQWLHEGTQQAGVPVQGFAGASPSALLDAYGVSGASCPFQGRDQLTPLADRSRTRKREIPLGVSLTYFLNVEFRQQGFAAGRPVRWKAGSNM